MEGALKILSSGQYGKIEETFVAVVRDENSYAELRQLAGDLPDLEKGFFETNAVVAAFLGTRRSGGYNVGVEYGSNDAAGGTLRISEIAPPKGSMTTQALTAPFSIVSIVWDRQLPPVVVTGEAWRASMRPYQVKGGEFTSSGGFAGRKEQFKLGGTLRTATLGKLVTIAFDLKSDVGGKRRALQTLATGLAGDNGSFDLPRLEAGTLADSPNGGMHATGQSSDNGGSLSLKFEPLPSNISDGFEGRGTLNADATAAPTPKRATRDGDVPM